MEILSGAKQPKDIVSKEYVDGQINNHVHDADEIPCNTKVLKLGSKEYKISENLQKALENLLDYVYMNASGVLDLQTNLKSVSDTVSKIPAYKGGTGISVAGDTIGHSNNTLPGMVGTGEILTPDFGDTVYTTWFSYDAQGHVTQSGTGGFVIPTVDDRSKIYPETSMTALGFTAKSTIPVYEFLSKLYEKGYTANSIVPIKWADANTATVSDGTNSISINGGTLYIGKLKDLSTSWKESHAVFIQNAGKGQTITIISAASSANTGASSAQHVTNFTSNAAYLKKTDVSNQTELYTSTTDTSFATITNLFANYSLVWFQVVGSKTTHTHILPLAYLKSKGSLTFKDSGTPINILYVSDTQIRWFEYQGQGAETYTSVTIVRII